MTGDAGSERMAGSLLDVAAGIAAPVVTRGSAGASRLLNQLAAAVTRVVDGPLPQTVFRLAPQLEALAASGRTKRTSAADAVTVTTRSAVDSVARDAIGCVDLTQLVQDNVDLDALAATIDVDAIADRIDLLRLADYVVYGIDLPAIIRQSTHGVTSDAVQSVRLQSAHADQAVAKVVDRILLRSRTRRVDGPNGYSARTDQGADAP